MISKKNQMKTQRGHFCNKSQNLSRKTAAGKHNFYVNLNISEIFANFGACRGLVDTLSVKKLWYFELPVKHEKSDSEQQILKTENHFLIMHQLKPNG